MYRNQLVTDGPAGPDRIRRPVGTDGMHAVHDVDRPTAGGPVGRLRHPQTNGISHRLWALWANRL